MKESSTWIKSNVEKDEALVMYTPETSSDCKSLRLDGKCKDCVVFNTGDKPPLATVCGFWQDVECEGYDTALENLEIRIEHIKTTSAEDRMIAAQERGMM